MQLKHHQEKEQAIINNAPLPKTPYRSIPIEEIKRIPIRTFLDGIGMTIDHNNKFRMLL